MANAVLAIFTSKNIDRAGACQSSTTSDDAKIDLITTWNRLMAVMLLKTLNMLKMEL
jgi:hypothetical protein